MQIRFQHRMLLEQTSVLMLMLFDPPRLNPDVNTLALRARKANVGR